MKDMCGIKYVALSGLKVCRFYYVVPLHGTLAYFALSGLTALKGQNMLTMGEAHR